MEEEEGWWGIRTSGHRGIASVREVVLPGRLALMRLLALARTSSASQLAQNTTQVTTQEGRTLT